MAFWFSWHLLNIHFAFLPGTWAHDCLHAWGSCVWYMNCIYLFDVPTRTYIHNTHVLWSWRTRNHKLNIWYWWCTAQPRGSTFLLFSRRLAHECVHYLALIKIFACDACVCCVNNIDYVSYEQWQKYNISNNKYSRYKRRYGGKYTKCRMNK